MATDDSDTKASRGTEVHQAHVLFCRNGTEGVWLATEDHSLLELARAKGLELPFSCRSGYCQTCQCRIVEGEVRCDLAPLCAPAPRYALLCCARPASPVLVLDA
jgi:ferredoxin